MALDQLISRSESRLRQQQDLAASPLEFQLS